MSKIQLIAFGLLSFMKLTAQDVILQYKDWRWDYTQQALLLPWPFPTLEEPYSGFTHDLTTYTNINSGGYSGEYMICLYNHPWYTNLDIRQNLAVTYDIELVSFPFTMPCIPLPISCNATSGVTNVRNLTMPSSSYNPNDFKWDNYLHNKRLNGNLYGISEQQPGGKPDALTSSCFVQGDTYPLSVSASLIPHSILKHTINLHCTTSVSSPIIASYS